MSDDRCKELDAVVAGLRLGDRTSMDRLERLKDVEGCITDGLTRSAAIGDWTSFERFLLAASRYPHRSMSEVLCDVLGRQLDTVNNEDIVEVLGTVADPEYGQVPGDRRVLGRVSPTSEEGGMGAGVHSHTGGEGGVTRRSEYRITSTASAEIREAATGELRRAGG